MTAWEYVKDNRYSMECWWDKAVPTAAFAHSHNKKGDPFDLT